MIKNLVTESCERDILGFVAPPPLFTVQGKNARPLNQSNLSAPLPDGPKDVLVGVCRTSHDKKQYLIDLLTRITTGAWQTYNTEGNIT